MGRALEAIAYASRPRYIVVGRAIWGIRRVNSDDLRQVGYAMLEGGTAGRQAAAEMTALRRQARDLAAGSTPDQVAKHEAELQAQLISVVEKRDAAINQSPEGSQALQRRLDGYVMAAVERCGILRPDAVFARVDLLPDDADPSMVTIDLRSPEEIAAGKAPMYSEPVSIVAEEKDADPSAGRLWLHSLSAEDRRALGLAIAQLQGQSALAEVTPFRGDARAPGATVASVAGVPEPDAARVPRARAVAAGARGGGGGGRKEAAGRQGRRSEDGVSGRGAR